MSDVLQSELSHDDAPQDADTAISPGTPVPSDLFALDGTERGKEFLLRTPMKRFGQREELIGAALLLASPAASYMAGQCIAVDGGFLASGVNQ